MSAFNLDGNPVNVGDRVSILGVITALSSPVNENTTVTIQPPLSASTFQANALDVRTVEGTGNGPTYGNSLVVGNDCTTTGLVTAISGRGNTATLTVKLTTSGSAVSVPSGACHSDNV
jgi:hypothetical protein